MRIAPDGNQTVVATLAPGTRPGGLAVDADGVVAAAATALDLQTGGTDPALRGVVRVSRDGTASRLPGTNAMTFANDVALDRRGTVYATDTIEGAVWRIPRGGAAQLWAQHPLLEGNGSFGFGFPIGANGIAIRHDRLIVANTEKGLLMAIPVQPDGSAGEPSILTESPALVGVDGITLDVHGNVYAATGIQNTVVRVLTDGTIETLATGDDGLNQPSTMTFGAGRRDNQHLFIANFSLFVPDPTPGVLTLPTISQASREARTQAIQHETAPDRRSPRTHRRRATTSPSCPTLNLPDRGATAGLGDHIGITVAAVAPCAGRCRPERGPRTATTGRKATIVSRSQCYGADGLARPHPGPMSQGRVR